MNQKDYKSALIDFSKAIESNPSHDKSYVARAELKVKQNNVNEALLDINKAIEIEANNPEYYLKRLGFYAIIGKVDKACLDYKKYEHLGGKLTSSSVKNPCH
jgi:Tfp pilus assembly protein PilF